MRSGRQEKSAAIRGTTTRRWISTRMRRTGALTRLTTARGYDAEGSYSPDGRWLVFTSMRDAYNRVLTDGEQKQLEIDPATSPRSTTSCVRTGRARTVDQRAWLRRRSFLHPRWLAHRLAPIRERCHRQRLDDEAGRQRSAANHGFWFDELGALRAPVGRKLIFASNKLGFENFELFMVDTAGTKEPVRVTYSDGFDGLPVPSPDGKLLASASTRGGGTAGQLFLGQWNHEKALEAIAKAPLRKAGNTR